MMTQFENLNWSKWRTFILRAILTCPQSVYCLQLHIKRQKLYVSLSIFKILERDLDTFDNKSRIWLDFCHSIQIKSALNICEEFSFLRYLCNPLFSLNLNSILVVPSTYRVISLQFYLSVFKDDMKFGVRDGNVSRRYQIHIAGVSTFYVLKETDVSKEKNSKNALLKPPREMLMHIFSL